MNYHLTEIRPTLEIINKIKGLQQYLKENDLMLIHEASHVHIIKRSLPGTTIATFFVL